MVNYIVMKQIKNIIIALLCLLPLSASAQYVGELGLMGGVSYYNGDANSTTPFYENHPAGGAFLRLKMTPYWVFRLDVDFGSVSGDINNFPDNKFPFDEASFKHDFWNTDLMFELDFFKYGDSRWDREMKRHTPYVAAGPSLALWRSWNGNQMGGGLALGVGYKFKLGDRFNIGVEWNMHKLFRDDFDDDEFGERLLDDPLKMGHSNIKNNDWYSFGVVFISMDIFKRRGTCHILK